MPSQNAGVSPNRRSRVIRSKLLPRGSNRWRRSIFWESSVDNELFCVIKRESFLNNDCIDCPVGILYYSDRFPIILVTIQFISDIIATDLTGSIRARRWDRHILRPAAGGRNVPGGSPVSGIRRNRKRWISRQAEKEVR